MARKEKPNTEDLEELRGRLEEWRKARPGRGRLPEDLWKAAVEAARRHGVYRTWQALPIDYGGLKRRLNEGRQFKALRQGSAPLAAQFVELLAPPPEVAGYTVEMLRVHASGPMNWGELLRAWRRDER